MPKDALTGEQAGAPRELLMNTGPGKEGGGSLFVSSCWCGSLWVALGRQICKAGSLPLIFRFFLPLFSLELCSSSATHQLSSQHHKPAPQSTIMKGVAQRNDSSICHLHLLNLYQLKALWSTWVLTSSLFIGNPHTE